MSNISTSDIILFANASRMVKYQSCMYPLSAILWTSSPKHSGMLITNADVSYYASVRIPHIPSKGECNDKYSSHVGTAHAG